MLVNKVTVGFVIQVFEHGAQAVRLAAVRWRETSATTRTRTAPGYAASRWKRSGKEVFLPFNMVQPQPPRKCVRVEYDPDYTGGDYSSVGQFAYIPHEVIDRLPRNDPDANLKTAFTVLVGDPRHIIHYTFDEPTDQDGNEWKEND